MILDTIKEIMNTQNYCMIMTCDYPLEGFITNLKDDNIEMYIFSPKDLDHDCEEEDLDGDRIIERVVFPVAHIEYIYPDHYLRLPLPDLESKKMLKNQILKQRSVDPKSKSKSTKKVSTKKENPAKNA
jgi:hypothetical protein